MADPNMYHAMGSEDPNQHMAQQVPPQGYPAAGYPPGAAPPQPGAAYRNPSPNQWPAYGSPQQTMAPGADAIYNATPQAPMGAPGDPGMAGLTSQMGGMGIA